MIVFSSYKTKVKYLLGSVLVDMYWISILARYLFIRIRYDKTLSNFKNSKSCVLRPYMLSRTHTNCMLGNVSTFKKL